MLKRFMLALVAIPILLVLLGVGLNYIGPRFDDEANFEAYDPSLESLPREKNAFRLLENHFLAESGSDVYASAINNPLESFDLAAAQYWLGQNKSALTAAQQAIELGQMETYLDNFLDLPPYSELGFFHTLLLLNAKVAISQQNYPLAVGRIGESLSYCRLLQADNNATLLGYFIGSAYCRKSLFFILDWVNNAPLPESTLTQLAALLEDHVNAPSTFHNVWRGEFIFGQLATKYVLALPLSDRWHFLGGSFGPQEANKLSIGIASLIQVLAPRYAFHPNRMNNKLHQEMQSLAALAKQTQFCFPQPDEPEAEYENTLLPGALGMYLGNTEHNHYYQYFERDCLNRAFSESVRVAVAIQRHNRKHKSLPEDLEDLVPEFLAQIPNDPFRIIQDPSPTYLVYTPESNSITSNGNDYLINTEPIDQKHWYSLTKQCGSNDECLSAPTFDLSYTPSIGHTAEPSIESIKKRIDCFQPKTSTNEE